MNRRSLILSSIAGLFAVPPREQSDTLPLPDIEECERELKSLALADDSPEASIDGVERYGEPKRGDELFEDSDRFVSFRVITDYVNGKPRTRMTGIG